MPYPRQLWSDEYFLLEVNKTDSYDNQRLLSIIIGADDPMMLEEERAIEFAKSAAEEKLDAKLIENGEIKVYGQNCLAERTFYLKENRKLFMVRSKPGDLERLPEFLSSNFIAIGWTETGDLARADKDDIRMVLRQLGFKSQSLGQNVRIVNNFINEMKPDDVVLVPEKDKNLVHVGIVSPYEWREDLKLERMAHYRQVKWASHVEWDKLNQKVQNFLKLTQTVNQFQFPIREAELGLAELLEHAPI